jgi:hypothetical protein
MYPPLSSVPFFSQIQERIEQNRRAALERLAALRKRALEDPLYPNPKNNFNFQKEPQL